MELLGNGVITVVNGLLRMLWAVVDPMTVIVTLLGLSLAWLALIERDELDRQGTKPEIGRGL